MQRSRCSGTHPRVLGDPEEGIADPRKKIQRFCWSSTRPRVAGDPEEGIAQCLQILDSSP